MLSRRTFVLAPAAVLASCARRKGTGFPGYAFVANQDGRAIAAVDLTAFAVARHIPLGGAPAAVLAHPVRPAIYALDPGAGAVYEISTGTLSVARRAQPVRSAVAMRLGRDGALWLLARDPRALVPFDLSRFRPGRPIPLPADPLDFDLSPDGRLAAVSFAEGRGIGVAELAAGVFRGFPFDRKLFLVRFRSDARQLLAGNIEDRALAILDVRTGRVVSQLPLAVRPDCFCFNSNQGQLFITGDGMDAVAIVYPYRTEVAETVLAGRAPGPMAECDTEDASYLLVTNPQAGEVTIVDIDSHKAIAAVTVGRNPSHIVITPDRQYALVLNRDSGDMAVIFMKAISARRTKSAPLFTMIPVGSKPVSAAVRAI